MRKFLAVLLSVYLLFAGLTPARAQSSTRLSLYTLQTASFPSMTAGLDVFDAAGNFVTGLTPAAVTLLEDNQPLPLSSLEELQPGTEFVLALDPGPDFIYQGADAVNRFHKVVIAVQAWAASHPDTLGDDLSLLPTGGTPATHLAATAAFSDALTAYLPDLQKLVSGPEILSRALDVVSESPQPGRKPVVLYITSVPSADAIPALQNLTQRAVTGQVRVTVWIVGSKDLFSTSGATALHDLAIQTGGQYVPFSGEEPLPSLETYLSPLRHTYRLAYFSSILTSGGHTLTAQVSLNGETVTSAALTFELNVQPPNPILVAPPVQIVRTAPEQRTTAAASFLPTQQAISIIIEFPDGLKRPLVRTALYVDGALVDENTVAPFDQFTWDLSGYAASGQHILTVEAVDNIGLSKVSLGVPVLVTVVRPQLGLLPWLSRNSLWVALGAILLAGGGLGVILTRGLVRKRRSVPAGRASREVVPVPANQSRYQHGARGEVVPVPANQSRYKHGARGHDPLTQSVQSGGKKRGQALPWSRPAKPSEAYLVRLKDDGQPITAPPIPISMPEITFGSDPIQATRILDDLSVSPLHARLKEEHGGYILSDEKSVAGTWVNYEQLTTPRRLQHGDVIHLGRVSYRFMLRKPPERPALQVTPTTKPPRFKNGKK